MRFDPHITELAEYARWHFGPHPRVTVLALPWQDRAPDLFRRAGVPVTGGPDVFAPVVSVVDGEPSDTDWLGDLELWAGTSDRVLLRRVAMYDDGLQTVLLAAAPRRENIDRAVREGTALWRRWRREVAQVATGLGRRLAIPCVSWDDLYLPAPLLADVRTTVTAFAGARDRYRDWKVAYRRGLLFHGAPGNGKTMLCRAIVTALGWPVIFVDGDNARTVPHAFESARELAPCILCFEDVDSLFDGPAALSSFLNRLDGFDAGEGVLVLATTNHPDKLDPALTSRPSRFDRVYAVDDPDVVQRGRYLRHLFAGAPLTDADLDELARDTDGLSMAFLKEIFVGAALRASTLFPTVDDVRAALPGLLTHRRSAARAFATTRATGFSPLPPS